MNEHAMVQLHNWKSYLLFKRGSKIKEKLMKEREIEIVFCVRECL